MKGLNIYNEPPFFDAVYAIVSPFVKEKTIRRVSCSDLMRQGNICLLLEGFGEML